MTINARRRVLEMSLTLVGLLPLVATGYSAPSVTNPAHILGTASDFFSVVARTANSRTWHQVNPVLTNEQGLIVYQTNAYVELATGMHRLVNGAWVSSSEEVDVTPTGGVASHGRHQVRFSGNLNSSNAVEVLTPDAKSLRTHILGLSYFDSASGSNVLIAELKNSAGRLTKSNQVVYPDAFTDLRADARYTYRRSGVEQDIVIHEQLPDPGVYGLNRATTKLQVWTEFLDSPSPAIERHKAGGDITLDFGAMRISRGKAFVVGDESNSVPVAKEWVTTGGRTFLVEQIPLNSVAARLEKLPSPAEPGRDRRKARFQGFPDRLPPVPALAASDPKPLQLAEGKVEPEDGLVMDYFAFISDESDYTFQSDTTYYVTGPFNLSGTTTIEGGTVIKFSDDNGENLMIGGPLICPSSQYQMAVLTSKDDDSAGEAISGSSGSPSTGTQNYYLESAFDNEINPKNLRFSFAFVGLAQTGVTDIRDCQFVDCNYGVQFNGGDDNGNSVYLGNVLFTGGIYGLGNAGGPAVVGEQITSDTGTSFIDSDYYLSSFDLKNSIILAWSGFSRPYFTSENLQIITDPFEIVFGGAGAGGYYLASDAYRNAGTTGIDPDLLNELRTKTTYPPAVPTTFTDDDVPIITTDTVLTPQAPRDTDTPDLGYHYAPIDYMTTCMYSNCTVTLTNGVVLAYWRNLGIWLNNDSHFVSQGTPNLHNVIAYYNLIQEQPIKLLASDPDPTDYPRYAFPVTTWHPNIGDDPTIFTRFTTFYAPQQSLNILYTLGDYEVGSLLIRDSEFFGSGAGVTLHSPPGGSADLKNNLFQYTQVFGGVHGAFSAFNNLHRGTASDSFSETDYGGGSITNRDNAFDATSVNLVGTNGHNAYLNGATVYSTVVVSDITADLTWENGPLGAFYQPSDSPLIDAGSRTADLAALYHYTTQTNQAVETNSTVDVGYHYVAVDANGNPLDSDLDGFPDYVEDGNGNGVFDAGDSSDWQDGGDVGLFVIISRPQANSTIP